MRSQVADLRAHAGLAAMHGPGVEVLLRNGGAGPNVASQIGYRVNFQDVQDVVNLLFTNGAEAIDVNNHWVATGVPVSQSGGGMAIDGVIVTPPWTISAIGDSNRMAEVADLMTRQLRADRRVRQVSYRVDPNIVIRSVVSAKPFVYAIAS